MRVFLLILTLLAAVPASAQWTQIDTNYGLTAPYATDLLGADASTLYALVLAKATNPAVWNVMRSSNDGDSWSSVRTIPSNGAVEATFLNDLDGLLVAAVPNNTETVVHLSEDGGTTWTEATPVPSQLVATFARSSDVLLASGLITYRSTDKGAIWTEIQGTSGSGFARSVHFAGAFWAPDQAGFMYRLADGATTWERLTGSPMNVSGIWIDNGTLWVRGRTSFIGQFTLISTTDGVTWTEQTTDQPTAYLEAYPAADDDDPWFLTTEASFASSVHFLSSDDGASLTDITAGYPLDTNDRVCISTYATTATSAIAATTGGISGASGCTPGTDPNAGVYRYTFGGSTASEGSATNALLTLELTQNPTRGGTPVLIRQLEPGPLTVTLTDALGRRVAVLTQDLYRAGETTVRLPRNLAPGVYGIRAVSGEQVATRSVTVVR